MKYTSVKAYENWCGSYQYKENFTWNWLQVFVQKMFVILTRHKSQRHAWCQKEGHPGLLLNIKNPELGKFEAQGVGSCTKLLVAHGFSLLTQGTNLVPAGLLINTRKGRRAKSTESVIRRPRDTKVPLMFFVSYSMESSDFFNSGWLYLLAQWDGAVQPVKLSEAISSNWTRNGWS